MPSWAETEPARAGCGSALSNGSGTATHGRSGIAACCAASSLRRAQTQAVPIHGATPEWMEELKKRGYDHVDLEQLIAFRIHGVSPEFIDSLQRLGYKRFGDTVRANGWRFCG
jgi:hypothetical protein